MFHNFTRSASHFFCAVPALTLVPTHAPHDLAFVDLERIYLGISCPDHLYAGLCICVHDAQVMSQPLRQSYRNKEDAGRTVFIVWCNIATVH